MDVSAITQLASDLWENMQRDGLTVELEDVNRKGEYRPRWRLKLYAKPSEEKPND